MKDQTYEQILLQIDFIFIHGLKVWWLWGCLKAHPLDLTAAITMSLHKNHTASDAVICIRILSERLLVGCSEEKTWKTETASHSVPTRRGHQACLLAGFPIALNHCHLCLQLQEQMPRKNPSAKAEARESRYRNLEHCRNWYRRGENSVAQVTQPTKCSQETWLRIRETWLECRFFEGASQGTQCHQTVRVCNCFAIK